MSKPIFPYKNLHHYLDKYLSEAGITNPSKQEIKRLKKKFWRLKNNHIKAVKRCQQREVTLYFTDKQVKQLQKRKADNQSFPNLVHSLVMATINNESIYVIRHDPKLEQLLFNISDTLEDLMESSPIHQSQLKSLQNKIQTLENNLKIDY